MSVTPLPETVDSCEVSGVPDVKGSAENIRLSEFLHLTLSVSNLSKKKNILKQGLLNKYFLSLNEKLPHSMKLRSNFWV